MVNNTRIVQFLAWRIRKVLAYLSRFKYNRPSQRVDRVLCLIYGGLGDHLMALPAVRHLRRQYPNAAIRVAWIGSNLPIDEAGIDRQWSINRSHLWRIARLACWRPSLIFVNSVGIFDLSSEIATFISGAMLRIGPKHPHMQSSVYNRPFALGGAHETVLNCRATGWSGPEVSLSYPITIAPKSIFVHSAVRRVVLHVTCKPGYEAKRWPAAKYRQLIEALSIGNDLRFTLIGQPVDRPLLEAVANGLPSADVKVLQTIDAVIDTVLDSRVFIGNDSGPAHLAAALGKPTVVVMAPTNPALCAPISKRTMIIAEPCDKGYCYYSGAECVRCIDRISVHSVVTAIRDGLEANSTRNHNDV